MAMNANLKNIYLYARFERLWHWLQTLVIILLLLTGFEVNGVFTLLGFSTAVTVHNFAGLTWLIAFAFFVFWIFTTGEWRQYIPTTKKMLAVVRYYMLRHFPGRTASGSQAQGSQTQSAAAHRVPDPGGAPAAGADGDGVSILGLQFLERMGAVVSFAAGSGADAHRRCVCDSVFCHRARLYDHHRPHGLGPHPGDDHGLGRGGG